MLKHLTLVVFMLIHAALLFAQPPEDNVIITRTNSDFTFRKKSGKVVVEEKTNINYEALRRGTTIQFVESYDSYTTLDKITAKKKPTPKYQLYTNNEMFYSDMKICFFDLFFDRQGATSEVKFEKTYTDPRYFTTVYFADEQFIREKKVTVTVPTWMDAELVEYNFGENIRKEVNLDPGTQDRVYTYIITNQPAMKQEGYMRGRSFIFPHIKVVSKSAQMNGKKEVFFQTIDDLYAWYHHIAKQVNNDAQTISEQAKKITAHCTSDREKIKAIFGWVQDHIRYLAFEDGIAAYKPDDAQEVLRKKYGDCKGMANLLKGLLTAEGFDARLAWIGTNAIAYDYSTPTLSVDNHMICALFFENNLYYLDATYKYMPLGEYPESIQGKQTLIEDKDTSKYLLERVPVLPPEVNADSLFIEYHFADNQLTGTAVQSYQGESKEVIMSLMEATAKDRLQHALQNFLENNYTQDTAKEVEIKGTSAQSDKIEMHYQLINHSGVQIMGNEIYLSLDHTKSMMNNLIDPDKRVNDLAFPYRKYAVERAVLHIPEGFRVTHVPEPLNIEKEDYSMQLAYEQQDGKIIYERKIRIHAHYLPKAKFSEWNNDISRLRKAYMEQLVLTK